MLPSLSVTNPLFRLRVARRQRQRRQVPDCLPGQTVGPPDFVGIGVQRCGSTWWDRLIETHPQVYRAPGRDKEVHYFDQFARRPWEPGCAQEYARYFPRSPGQVAGEWTPRYLYDVWALPLLLEAAPQARLLVLLRDPVARFVSGLTRHTSWGGGLAPATLQQAFERGRYAAQLERLYGLVEPERVLVLQFERCRDEPREQLARTYRFLGITDDHVPDLGHTRDSSAPAPELPPRLLESVRQAYAADVARLPALVPDLDLGRWTDYGPATA